MTKNPFLNAFAAALYIMIVASIMYYGAELGNNGKTLIVPIAIISLFTLSAAIVGYLFLFEPLQRYLEGDKKGAVNFFLQTVATFAGITTLIFLALFFGIFS